MPASEFLPRICPYSPADVFVLFREDAAEMTSIASSIVFSIQLPDPSEAGLFNAPQRPRLRNYQMLSGTYTYVSSMSSLSSTNR